VASTGADNTVRVWDITNQKCVSTYPALKNVSTALDWNYNGSLLGTMSKDKTLTIFDPRKEGGALITNSHEGARPQKFVWCGNTNYLVSMGFSKISERQYAAWDLRDLSNPLIMKRLDDYGGIPFCFFEDDSKLIFVAGKGESQISQYQFNENSPNHIDFLDNFTGKEPQKGFSFMPKRVVDCIKCEIARGVRMTAKTVEYVSFKLPRKSGTFQEDLYPPTKSGEAAMTFEEYWNGADKEPVKFQMRPDSPTHVAHHRKATFLSKLKGEAVQEEAPAKQAEPPKPSAASASALAKKQANEAEIASLRDQIAKLQAELEEARQEAERNAKETARV